jgi:alpha-amylase
MKHMEPADLADIFGRLKNLNVNFGFPSNSKAFIVGEVIEGPPISGSEYFSIGTVTEFRYSNDLTRVFKGQTELRWLRNFGEGQEN